MSHHTDSSSPFDWLINLFAPVEFEFDTALSLEQCRLLLQKEFNNGSWMLNNVHKAEVNLQDDGSHRFRVYKQLVRGLAIEARGFLEAQSDVLTQVRGRTRIHRGTYTSVLLITLIVLAYLVFAPDFGQQAFKLAFALVFALAILLIFLVALARQDNLVDQIRDVLLRE